MNKPIFYKTNNNEEVMVTLRIMSYRDSNAMFAILVHAGFKNEGVPFKNITARPDQNLPLFHGAIKAEDKDIGEMLVELGLAEPTDELVYAGFQTLNVYAFNIDALMQYDSAGTKDYIYHLEQKGVEVNVCS